MLLGLIPLQPPRRWAWGGRGALPPPGLAAACSESLKTCLPDLASFTGLDALLLVGDGNQNQMLTVASGGSLLLPLLSCSSRVQLRATPQTAAHQAALSLGFSRQEHWSGLPFPSPLGGSLETFI